MLDLIAFFLYSFIVFLFGISIGIVILGFGYYKQEKLWGRSDDDDEGNCD